MALSKLTRPFASMMNNSVYVPTMVNGMRQSRYHAYAVATQPLDEEPCDKTQNRESIVNKTQNRESIVNKTQHRESIVKGENVILLGADNIGKSLTHQLLGKQVKTLTVIDHNVGNVKRLKEEVKDNYPRAAVSYILDDILSSQNTIHQVLQVLGSVDMIIDATNVTFEENNEDTLKPSSMALNQFLLGCLDTVKPGGRFVTFKNTPGFPAALCNYKCISMMGMDSISSDTFVKMCMHRIEKTQPHTNEKVVYSFFTPRFDGR